MNSSDGKYETYDNLLKDDGSGEIKVWRIENFERVSMELGCKLMWTIHSRPLVDYSIPQGSSRRGILGTLFRWRLLHHPLYIRGK